MALELTEAFKTCLLWNNLMQVSQTFLTLRLLFIHSRSHPGYCKTVMVL